MIQILVADADDAALVGTMLERLFGEVEHHPDRETIAAVFPELEENEAHSTLIACNVDEEPVGILTLAETAAIYAGGRIGVINELYVDPEYRSEGVGKMLLDTAKALAAVRGWKRLEVTTPGDKFDRTLHFYEKEGFFPIGTRYKYMVE